MKSPAPDAQHDGRYHISWNVDRSICTIAIFTDTPFVQGMSPPTLFAAHDIPPKTPIRFDVRHVNLIGSSCIGFMLACHQMGHPVSVHGARNRVQVVLKSLNIQTIIPMHPTLA